MFIQKLTNEDIDKILCGLYGKGSRVGSMQLIKMDNSKNDFLRINVINHDLQVDEIICLYDFKVMTKNVNTKCLKRHKYKTFMYRKFGGEYKKTFNQNLKQGRIPEMVR